MNRVGTASVLVAAENLETREFPIPTVGPNDGILRVEACGICGADIELFRGEHVSRGVHYPVIPGHEPVGLIEEIGALASQRWGVRVGDRVVVEPVIPCGHCANCLDGRYNSCRPQDASRLQYYSGISTDTPPGLWGGYAEYMYLHPNSLVHKISASVPPELAVMFNPLANGIKWACSVPATKLGDTVVVMGSGQRGLACTLAASAAGAGCIITTDLTVASAKLGIARELGAHHTVEVDKEDVLARVTEITEGRLADVVIDTSSQATQPVVDALEVVRTGGTVVLGGLKNGAAVPGFISDRIVRKAITVKGVSGTDHSSFVQAVRLIESGRFPLARLHTHDFPLQEAEQAIRTLAREVPAEDSIHIAIRPWAA